MRIKLGIAAVAAGAILAAGCGGGGGGGGGSTSSGGASVVPDTAVAYVSVSSNLDSAGWKKAEALLDRFPGKDTVLANLRSSLEQEGLDWKTDVKPALGDEIDLVWLDFQNGGEDLVALTRPKDTAKFDALLQKGTSPTPHDDIDGWTVFASSQSTLDQFKQAHDDNGSLADDSAFSDGFGGLPGDALAKAWVGGDAAQTAFDQRLAQGGAPAGTTRKQIGSLESIAAAVTPGSDGISITTSFNGDLDLGGGGYHADLPGTLPAGAIFYVSFKGIGNRIDKLVSSFPGIGQQRAQIELVLGYPLSDVFGLLSGEGAVAFYKTPSGFEDLFVSKVSDESKAKSILDRLATLAAASGQYKITTTQIGSVQARDLALSNGSHAYTAVFDGMLVTTNSRQAITELQGSGPKLANDPDFKAALAHASSPDQTGGFVYAKTDAALDYLFTYLEGRGRSISQTVKDNTAPLGGLLLYGAKDGNSFTLTGFLGIQ